jgi:hypothetical protein
MTETIVLALDGCAPAGTVGARIDPRAVADLARSARRHGFRVATGLPSAVRA